MQLRNSNLGDYLRARRASMQASGDSASTRRVPGLRREEVADLAGISTAYYLRLEQGRARSPSVQVLRSLGRALELDADALAYMMRIADADGSDTPDHSEQPDEVTIDFVRRMRDVGALLVDHNLDILAYNAMAAALIPEVLNGTVNIVAWIHQSDDLGLQELSEIRRDMISLARFRSSPDDPRIAGLVEELSRSVEGFADVWALHESRHLDRYAFRREFDHIGEVNFSCQTFVVGDGPYAVHTVAGDGSDRGKAAIALLQAQGDAALRRSTRTRRSSSTPDTVMTGSPCIEPRPVVGQLIASQPIQALHRDPNAELQSDQ